MLSLHRPWSAMLFAGLSLLSSPNVEASVQARVALDREIVEWRQEHTLYLLIDFSRPGEAMICPPIAATEATAPVAARAAHVTVEMWPNTIVREIDAPGFPSMAKRTHPELYAGTVGSLLLRIRTAPANAGVFSLGRLRVTYEDPETEEPGLFESELTLTTQIDEETANRRYEKALAALDAEAPATDPETPATLVVWATDISDTESLEEALAIMPDPIPAPNPRVVAERDRIMASFERTGRRPGNPADGIFFGSCVRRRPFSVVLDPGHAPTDEDWGRAGRKAAEAVYNDRIAAALARRLEDLGLRVTISREGPDPLPMDERIAVINEARPDLVVSLHHDNVSPKRTEARRIPGTVMRICREYEGFSIYARNTARDGPLSHAAARFIADELRAYGRPVGRFFELGNPATGVYSGAGLALLSGMTQPAILVELGYLCNPREKRLFDRERFVENEARMLANALRRYVSAMHCVRPQKSLPALSMSSKPAD